MRQMLLTNENKYITRQFLMYMRYDIKQEFMPQFEKNRDELLTMMRTIPAFYSGRAKNVG